jgi:hypothetical protein
VWPVTEYWGFGKVVYRPQLYDALLYSVYNQNSGSNHINDPAIDDYRNRWFSALIASGSVEAVVAFGLISGHRVARI